ncbi:MAG: hypothetical protein HZB43_09460 [candidate division Zixibacteria bacterium]|nr:hypothetical protein [candidate division Zixibacteria bacterium]
MKKAMMVAAAIAITGLMAGGCSKTPPVQPVGGTTLGLRIVVNTVQDDGSITNTNNIKDHVQGMSILPENGIDSVTLNSGLVMVRSFKFVTAGGTPVDTNITAADEIRDIEDPAVRFHGPYVLLTTGEALDVAPTSIPVGFYPELRFVIQKASATDNLGGHQELIGSSLIISGVIWRGGQGTSFNYATDYTSEIAVGGVFNVGSNVNGTLTLTFNAGRWFRAGRSWVDPTNPSNNLQITRNIRNNVSAKLVG